MAITVVKTPQGHIVDTNAVTATASSSGGYVAFYKVAHGLVDGDVIYIYSNLGSYNGYWIVDKFNDDAFFIREYTSASLQA